MTAATNLAGLEPKDLVVAGISIHYYTGGEGEPLLLLHGLAGSSGNWVELMPDLVRRYRVIAVDLPGHAGSAKAPRGTGINDFAAVAAAVLEAEVEGPALVAGHSFGGLVALRLVRARPELVCGLLLISPAGIVTTTRITRAIVLASTTLRPGRWVAPFGNRYAKREWYRRVVFRPWFVSDATALSERATHGLLDAQRQHTDTRTAALAMNADDPRRDLAEVACPVLILWGARDPQLPLDDAFEYTRRLGAKLRVVADCGHLVIVERPAVCLDALAELAR